MEEAPPEQAWQEEYYDEVTGEILDPDKVQAARKEEVGYMHKLKVYVVATLEQARRNVANQFWSGGQM